MSSRKVAIADALVAAYASSYAATPRRVSIDAQFSRVWYTVAKQTMAGFPPYDHAAFIAGSVKVFVMAMDEAVGEQGRQRDRLWINYPVQVGIAARLKTATAADIDPLAQLSQELRDYPLKMTPAYSLGIVEQVTTPPNVLTDPDLRALQTESCFISVFEFTFKGTRPL